MGTVKAPAKISVNKVATNPLKDFSVSFAAVITSAVKTPTPSITRAISSPMSFIEFANPPVSLPNALETLSTAFKNP